MPDEFVRLACSGCGAVVPLDEPLPFRCINAGGDDDIDHVLRREHVATDRDWHEAFTREEPNPFVRYRELSYCYEIAKRRGMPDSEFVEMVRALDAKVAAVDGTGFVATPFTKASSLNAALGRSEGSILIKNETGNVSGSHKARHLFGILLWLEMARRTGLADEAAASRELAIASCGNAALAAAVVASAGERSLGVFIPTDAHPNVTKQLVALGARLNVCPREEGVDGDPCVHQFQERVAGGALPFAVQGNENGLTIEGGLTLGWEIVSDLLREGTSIDRLFIQVGGGALASSCVQALREAVAFDVLDRMPIIHAVQTEGAYPLWRAWSRVVSRILDDEPAETPDVERDSMRARRVGESVDDVRRSSLRHAASHRSEFMAPWETTPQSVAHGILDDETYDWFNIVEGMIETRGFPIVASEEAFREANALVRKTTAILPDHTGSAALAGCLALVGSDIISPTETLAVLVTGRER